MQRLDCRLASYAGIVLAPCRQTYGRDVALGRFVSLFRCYNRSIKIIARCGRRIRSPLSRLDTHSGLGEKQQREKVSNLAASALIFHTNCGPVGDANNSSYLYR